MGLKKLDQVSLVWFSDTLQVKYLAKVRISFVGDVDQVCLDEGFWWRRTDLERLENWVEP